MGLSALLLAVALALPGSAPKHEVVIVPLRPVAIEELEAIQAWELAFVRLEKQGRDLSLGFRRHRLGRKALYNARSEIFSCAERAECLLAFARSLGADLAVIGKVSLDGVRLELYDLDSGRFVVGAESALGLKSKDRATQVQAAVSGLLAELPGALASMAERRAQASRRDTP